MAQPEQTVTYRDFRDALDARFREAQLQDQRTLTVTCRSLLKDVKSTNGASASCVMWMEAGKGDFIVMRSPPSGAGGPLEITYGLPRPPEFPFEVRR